MIRSNSYSSIIINQPAMLAQRCCVRQRTRIQTRCVVYLSGNKVRKGMALQRLQYQQQQQRRIASGGDVSVKTVRGGAGTGAGAGTTSTGDAGQQTRTQTTHAISNPVLADIEKRWDDMPPQEQANLWMSLRDRLKVDWHDLTLNEKKAGMYLKISL